MPIMYHIDFDSKVVFERWTGQVSVTDITDLIEKEIARKKMPDGIRAIFILEAKPVFSITDVAKLLPVLMRHRFNLKGAKWGFVSNIPEVVAYLFYFQKISTILPLHMEIFSSYKTCINWLDLHDYHFPEVVTQGLD